MSGRGSDKQPYGGGSATDIVYSALPDRDAPDAKYGGGGGGSRGNSARLSESITLPPVDAVSELEQQRMLRRRRQAFGGSTGTSYQIKALVYKSFSLQMRQKGTLCCQIAVPLILVLIMGAIQLLLTNAINEQISGLNPAVTFPYPVYPAFFFNKSFMYTNSLNRNTTAGRLLDLQVGDLYANGSGSGLLGGIPTHVDRRGDRFPYGVKFDSRADIQAWVVNTTKENLKKNPVQDPTRNLPFAAMIFNQLNVTKPSLSFEIMCKNLIISGVPFKEGVETQLSLILSMMDSLALTYRSFIPFVVLQQPFPQIGDASNLDIASFVGGLFFPFAFSFLLPVFMYSIVYEKQEKLREMMKMMGLRMHNYWLVNYLFDMALYIVVASVIVLFSVAFQFAVIVHTSFVGLVLMLFFWGNAMISLAFVFSTFFNKTRTASIIGYMIVIMSVIVQLIIGTVVYPLYNLDGSPARHPGGWYYIYPPFAFYRSIAYLSTYCGSGQCPTWSDYNMETELGKGLLGLGLSPLVLFVLAWYLDNVLPKEFGVRKSPFFPLIDGWAALRALVSGGGRAPARLGNTSSENTPRIDMGHGSFKRSERTPLLGDMSNSVRDGSRNRLAPSMAESGDEDPDVSSERRRVMSGLDPSVYPVIIQSLHKKYDNGKVAVEELSLALEMNETLGLLGPNGAGKSTTISILTGLFPPSDGQVLLAGLDVATRMDDIHRVIGVCPQFDTLWSELTCEETLLFYSRLKGVSPSTEKAAVGDMLAQVGLGGAEKRLVSALSGGMRRRLSIAISLIGEPKIVLMDEPTTGLDPETRRNLWDVLLNVNKGRCVILTTHSMEEADVLSTRIAIMRQGRLACIGPQQHLKSRFGEGYTLRINTQLGKTEQVTNFIYSILPEAHVSEHFMDNVTFTIPRNAMKISDVFEMLDSKKEEYGLTDWALEQSSLEEIFLALVKEDESEVDPVLQ